MAEQLNQCDGCRRKLPIRQDRFGAIHYDPRTGWAFMGCTKDRYVKKVEGIHRPTGAYLIGANLEGVYGYNVNL